MIIKSKKENVINVHNNKIIYDIINKNLFIYILVIFAKFINK